MQDFKASKKRVNQGFHDRIAGRYDQMFAAKDAYWRFYRDITWRHLKPYLPVNITAHLLDLGCGTGEWGLRFLKSGYQVTFVDLSVKMLEQAQMRASKEVPHGKSKFVQADLEDLSALSAASFDFATAQGDPLSLCENPPQALAQIARALKPGGIFVASVDNRCAAYDYYFAKGDLAGLINLHKTGKTVWLAHKQTERFPLVTFDPASLRKLFQKAGFEVLDLIGKTVLPVRKYETLLKDPKHYRRILALEESLHKQEAYMGRASHLQIVGRKTL